MAMLPDGRITTGKIKESQSMKGKKIFKVIGFLIRILKAIKFVFSGKHTEEEE